MRNILSTILDNDFDIIDNLNPRFFKGFGSFPTVPTFHMSTRNNEPKVNIKKTDTEYAIELAVPSLTKEDIKVSLEDNVLTVKYDHKEDNSKKDNDGNYIRHEWSSNQFSQSWTLPEDSIADNISATTKHGVLTVNIPRRTKEQIRPKYKNIEIK